MYVKAKIEDGKAKIKIPSSNMNLTYDVKPIGQEDTIVSYMIIDSNGNEIGELEPSSKKGYFRWKLCPPEEIAKERSVSEKSQRQFFDEEEIGKKEKEIGIDSLKRIGKAIYSVPAYKYYDDSTIDKRVRIYYIADKNKKLDKGMKEKRLEKAPEALLIKTDGEEVYLDAK